MYEGGLWGCDDLVDSVRKHDQACECINGRDNVKIKSKAILLKNNLPKQNQRTFCFMIEKLIRHIIFTKAL